MGTKGTWQRPGDARAWDDNYRRIFRQKEREMPVKKMGKREAKALVKMIQTATKAIDRAYVTKIEGASYDDLETMTAAGLTYAIDELYWQVKNIRDELGA